MSGKQKGIFT